ncbi:MAG: riboflavin biosynthesis protein RibD, partial [Chloroflexi bacterium]|nr:riboflavin biosynthesis protein RibD [Chloroflexota bacterium]
MTHMESALALARRALGSTSPNPSVGAIVVKNGKIVAEGWTQSPGGEHAEAMA